MCGFIILVMFPWYKYLIVGLVFSHLGFWSGNLFLIAPFPGPCLPVPFNSRLKCSAHHSRIASFSVRITEQCYSSRNLWVMNCFQCIMKFLCLFYRQKTEYLLLFSSPEPKAHR